MLDRKASARMYPGRKRTKAAPRIHRRKAKGLESSGMRNIESVLIMIVITGIQSSLIKPFNPLKSESLDALHSKLAVDFLYDLDRSQGIM